MTSGLGRSLALALCIIPAHREHMNVLHRCVCTIPAQSTAATHQHCELPAFTISLAAPCASDGELTRVSFRLTRPAGERLLGANCTQPAFPRKPAAAAFHRGVQLHNGIRVFQEVSRLRGWNIAFNSNAGVTVRASAETRRMRATSAAEPDRACCSGTRQRFGPRSPPRLSSSSARTV